MPPRREQYTEVPTLALRELLDLLELQKLGQKAQAPSRTAAQYIDDPLGFVDHCVRFPEPRRKKSDRQVGLASYQRDIMQAVHEKGRVAVRGPRGLGKTTLASLVILWFVLTREMAGVEWKVVTTAGSWQQVRDFLWREVRKWVYQLDWEAIGRKSFSEPSELMKTGISLKMGLATAGSPDSPQKLEGAHADSIMYVFDEAKIIAVDTFESAEGAFSAADEGSDCEAFALAISTPGEPAGRFYDIHRRQPGLEDWHPVHVTFEQAVAAGRMSRKWATQRAKLWGVNSALYQNHVLGEFCADDEDAIIPLRWAEAAIDRWRAWEAEGGVIDPDGPHIVGVDVAHKGPDKSVAAIRHGNVITEIRAWSREDTMGTSGRLAAILQGDSTLKASIDVIGVGAGVYDRCKELGLNVEAFDVRKKTTRKDATGSFGFMRLRDAAWHNLREMLDPARGATLALPPDDELLGDLTALHFQHMSDGKIKVEEKADLRKRIGRSPDRGDAVVAAMWAAQGSFLDIYNVIQCENEKCPRGFFHARDGGTVRDRCPYCNTPIAGVEEAEETEAA